jgi:GNAT superfamily N-acetyltransferase
MRSGGDRGTRLSLSLSEVSRADDPRLAELSALLHRTFPDPNTVLGLDRMQAFLSANTSGGPRWFSVLVAEQPGQPVVGGCIFSYVPRANCGFSEYLVLDPNHRGQGVGRMLVERRRAVLDAQAVRNGHTACHGVFIEADNPRRTPQHLLEAEHITSLDAGVRLELFHHLGFRRVDVAYVQPPLERDKRAIGYMDLLFAPTESERSSLPSEWLFAALEAIWSAWAPEMFSIYLAALQRQVRDPVVGLVDPLEKSEVSRQTSADF